MILPPVRVMVESKVKTLPMVAGVDDSVSLPDGEPELFTNVSRALLRINLMRYSLIKFKADFRACSVINLIHLYTCNPLGFNLFRTRLRAFQRLKGLHPCRMQLHSFWCKSRS